MAVPSPAHVLVWLAAIAFLPAQCPTPDTWQASGTCPAPAGSVAAMVPWDPDGAGPLGVHVVCGGEFAYAGASATANVASYDPVARTWSALGAGFDGPVLALAVLGSGELIAGGAFTHSGAQPVARVARWNGTAWMPIGTGIGSAPSDAVAALVELPSGALIAAGEFAVAGGAAAANIASWNGTSWSPLGSGIVGSPAVPAPPNTRRVMHLGVRGNGDLIAGGYFTTAGGVPAHCVARWSGGAWSSLGLSPPTMLVEATTVVANGDVVVARSDQGSNHDVVRWNGSTWSPMGSAFLVRCTAFCELGNGTLLAHTLDGFSALGELVQWTGSAWMPMPTAGYTGPAAALLELGSGDLLLGGPVYSRGMPTVMRRSAAAWRAPAAGIDDWVNTIGVAPGEVVLGGWFRQVGDTPAPGVAVRRNGVWSALGGGVDGVVYALHRTGNGDWIVGGGFAFAGGAPMNHIARWNGSTWSPIGDPVFPVLAIAELPTGEFVVSTIASTVLRWNGSTWIQIGSFYAPALAVLQNGDLIAGCVGNPLVQRYSGGTWSSLGLSSTVAYESVTALRVLGNGDLLAGGSFGSTPLTLPHNLARWNGTSWTFLGQGVLSHVNDIDVLPGGDWLITHSGRDWNGQPRTSPSRWNGTTWSSVAGLDLAVWMEVSCLGIDDAGEFVVGGSFGSVQGVATGGLASRLAGCPAQAVPSGGGCTGAAGPVVLAVQTRPWLGDAYRALTTGLPSPSLALEVFGFLPLSLPLASVLPQAGAGCTLHVTPDVLLAAVPVAGQLDTTFPIPATISLLGLTFRHQVVPVELSAAGAITGVSASNALQMTLGAW